MSTSAMLTSAFLFLSALCHTQWTVSGARTPVILVPGIGGSVLEGRQTGPLRPECNRSSKNSTVVWLNPFNLINHHCLVDYLALTYNATTGRTQNSPGMNITVPEVGNTAAVEELWPLVPSWIPEELDFFIVFRTMVKDLIKLGYTRDLDLRGAPYDFRRAPNEMEDFYRKLKALIEDTYKRNNKMPVMLVAHSMGGLHVLYFLNHVTQAWKDTYVRSLVTLSAPWAGSVKAIRSIVSGLTIGILAKSLNTRPALRSFPAMAWLLTSPRFWNESEALVVTPKRKYTARMLEQLLTDVQANESLAFWRDVRNSTAALTPPGVEVHCLYGVGLKTEATLVYSKGSSDWMDHDPTIIPGEGDGTVNVRSLQGCLPWAKTQKNPFHSQVFPRVSHVDMLTDSKVFSYIRNLLAV